jgi:hypothetical protein
VDLLSLDEEGDGSDCYTEGMGSSKQNNNVNSVNIYLIYYEKSNDTTINTANTTTQKDSEQATASHEPSQNLFFLLFCIILLQ